MWDLFSDAKPWFPVKRFGYGAGPPTAWQGWFVMLSYIAALVGLAVLAERTRGMALSGVVVVMMLLTAAFVLLVRARTDGEWRWRWGEDD